MAELFEWKCPECNKEISSTHKGQFDYNKKLHIDSHKNKVAGNPPQTKEEIEKKRKILGGN